MSKKPRPRATKTAKQDWGYFGAVDKGRIRLSGQAAKLHGTERREIDLTSKWQRTLEDMSERDKVALEIIYGSPIAGHRFEWGL